MGADCNGKWKMKDEEGDGESQWKIGLLCVSAVESITVIFLV